MRSADQIPFELGANPTRAKMTFLTRRLALVLAGMLALLGLLSGRLYYLNVLRGPYFYELSENNFLLERPVSAPRGKVLASDGHPLAVNRTLYRLEMSPFGIDQRDIVSTIDRLATLMDMPELRDQSEKVIRSRPRWKQVTLLKNLEFKTVSPIIERLYQLSGVLVEPQYDRHHPEGASYGHVTGFAGPLTARQLERALAKGYLKTDPIGKMGSERQFEDMLRGVHGTEIYIRDARGRPRSSYVRVPAERGSDVMLTIEAPLQRLADDLMEGHKGVAIIMDPRDGAILAMISKPDYDPNYPMRGAASGKSSSYNKVTRGGFAPASTFKLVTAAAGLLAGRDPAEKHYCPGWYDLALPGRAGKRRFYCDIRSGHEELDMLEAIQKSCNVYFYHWANELGPEKLIEAAAGFGFGQRTEIDLTPESPGKLARMGFDQVYTGSVIQMGIGQGALILVTPLQLMNAYAALANGGVRHRLHILREIRSADGEIEGRYEPKVLGMLKLKAWQRESLIEGFRRVIAYRSGTGYRLKFPGQWNAAGKTGSAEVAGQKLTNGWFVAFAPFDDPKVCVLVLVEAEGHGGSTAGPIVRDLMGAYFDAHPIDALVAAQ